MNVDGKSHYSQIQCVHLICKWVMYWASEIVKQPLIRVTTLYILLEDSEWKSAVSTWFIPIRCIEAPCCIACMRFNNMICLNALWIYHFQWSTCSLNFHICINMCLLFISKVNLWIENPDIGFHNIVSVETLFGSLHLSPSCKLIQSLCAQLY